MLIVVTNIILLACGVEPHDPVNEHKTEAKCVLETRYLHRLM